MNGNSTTRPERRREQRFGREKVWGFITLLQHLKRAETDAGRSAYNLYRDTAGEIEARDAAARRSMDREQRRNTRPNIGNEDTVFSDADAFANAEGTDAPERTADASDPGEQPGAGRLPHVDPQRRGNQNTAGGHNGPGVGRV